MLFVSRFHQILSALDHTFSRYIPTVMLFAAGWSSCQIYFAISHSMAIRAMQDQQEENNEDEGDAEHQPKSGEESLPLKHALENEDEEVPLPYSVLCN
jgi:hypothetical protein